MSRFLQTALGVAAVVVALHAAGCGDAPLLRATFTSRVVQLESCKAIGDAPEGCARDEAISEIRTDLVEADNDAVWLYGVRRNSVDDRAVLGTRDQQGGFLFVDESVENDAVSGCELKSRLQLSLAIDPARVGDEGGDACIALVGREIETTTTSPECDAASVPPQQIVRTLRLRWEPLDETSTCE